MKTLRENIPIDTDSRSFAELEENDYSKYNNIYNLLDKLIESLEGKIKLFVLGEGTEEGTPIKLISTYKSQLEEEYSIDNEIPLIIVSTDFEQNEQEKAITKGFAIYPNHKVYMLEMSLK